PPSSPLFPSRRSSDLCGTLHALGFFLPRDLLGGNLKGRVGGRNTGIYRKLKQRFLNVAGFEIMLQARAQVTAKLLPPGQRGGRGEHQQTSRALVETRTLPD